MEKFPCLTGESDKKIPAVLLLNFPNLQIVYLPDNYLY